MSRAVIDQPGSRISLVGLIIALLLGFILKTQISPARVQVHLQKAVSRLEKDFIVDFEEAHVNLANWGLPWPRLEINRVRLSPKKNSCQSSQIFIEQIEVPISWSALIFSQTIVDVVRAHNVELRIGDLENCLALPSPNGPPTKKHVAATDQKENEKVVPAEVSLFQRHTNSQLKEIIIDQLKVIVKNQYHQPLAFRQLHIRMNYENESLAGLILQSQVLAIKDVRTDTFYLVGDLNAEVKSEGQGEYAADLNLKGRLLDGDLQLSAQYNSTQQKLNYELATKKVSIKAFLPLVNNAGDYMNVFERWPLGITLELFGASTLGSNSKSSLKIKTLEMAGENTSVQSEPFDIEIENDQPVVGPFNARIIRLPLNQLRGLVAFKNNLNSFENLGRLEADLHFVNLNDWRLDGTVLGTELIFSNRGTREIQIVDSIQFHVINRSHLYALTLNEFQINQSLINGQLEAHYNPANKNLTAQLLAEGKILNSRIWKQLTQVEQSPEIKLNWNYKKTLDERQQIFLSTPKINFEGIEVHDLNIDFIQAATDAGERTLVLNAKSSGAEIAVDGLTSPTVLALFNNKTNLKGSQYLAQHIQLDLKGNHWRNMKFDLNLDLKNREIETETARLKASGRWNEDNSIAGATTLLTGGRQIKFDIVRNGADEVLLSPLEK